MGRTSIFSQALADRICDELMEGKSLIKICDAEDMPHRVTVIRWMAQSDEFATRCAHARTAQADYMDDRILDVADNVTPETAQAAKVKISAYQWRAAKLAPKKYGDKLTQEVTGKDGERLFEPADADVAKALLSVLTKAKE